jgi:hypothetical protein
MPRWDSVVHGRRFQRVSFALQDSKAPHLARTRACPFPGPPSSVDLLRRCTVSRVFSPCAQVEATKAEVMKWRVVAEEATSTAEEFERRRSQLIDQAVLEHVCSPLSPSHYCLPDHPLRFDTPLSSSCLLRPCMRTSGFSPMAATSHIAWHPSGHPALYPHHHNCPALFPCVVVYLRSLLCSEAGRCGGARCPSSTAAVE